mgnify:CR=1 FL=1
MIIEFDILKNKNLKETIQLLKDSGYVLPKDHWFYKGLDEEKGDRYMIILGKNNEIFYREGGSFNVGKSVMSKRWYSDYIKRTIKQRINQL